MSGKGSTGQLGAQFSADITPTPHRRTPWDAPPHAPRYTAAKHLLTELKATLSDLQEQMESSDRIAHQSEVRHMNHECGYHALLCMVHRHDSYGVRSGRWAAILTQTLLVQQFYLTSRLSSSHVAVSVYRSHPPNFRLFYNMISLNRCRPRPWISCEQTYRGGWKVSKTTTTSKRTHWLTLLTSG